MESLEDADYSDQLHKIKIPSLLLWGQYDFMLCRQMLVRPRWPTLVPLIKNWFYFSHSGSSSNGNRDRPGRG